MNARASGFTLTELLVSLALAGLLIAGVSTAAADAARRHGELEQRALLRQRADHALGLLEPELQLAGYGGLSALLALPWPASMPSGATACGPVAPPVLRIDEGRYALPCPAQGGGAIAPSDVLTILRASARRAVPTPGRVQVLSSRHAGDPQGVLVDGAAAAGLTLREGAVELHDLERLTFYVAHEADGTPGQPALRLKELTAIGGRAALRDSEVVAGVEAMCIEQPGPNRVRVTVRVRSDHVVGSAREQRFDCRGRSVTIDDAFLREERSRTFTLRNALASDRP